MNTLEWILELISVLLLIIGLIYRKKKWGSNLIYFALGMLAVFLLTDWIAGWFTGLSV